jgi:hypothetical protein
MVAERCAQRAEVDLRQKAVSAIRIIDVIAVGNKDERGKTPNQAEIGAHACIVD